MSDGVKGVNQDAGLRVLCRRGLRRSLVELVAAPGLTLEVYSQAARGNSSIADMNIGIDITNFSPVAKVGINRY